MRRWTSIFSRFNEVLSGIAVVKSFVKEEDEKRRFLGGFTAANDVVARGVATDAKTNLAKSATLGTRVASPRSRRRMARRSPRGHPRDTRGVPRLRRRCRRPRPGRHGHVSDIAQGHGRRPRSSKRSSARADASRRCPDARDVGALAGRRALSRDRFAYRECSPVLRNVSFHARPGETIALVGGSGGGKSTLMGLLQRLYDPCAGTIFLDGTTSASSSSDPYAPRSAWSSRTRGSSTTRSTTTSPSANPNATAADVVAAARAANAHEFIVALPGGYDSHVGERGCKLSGGERQRDRHRSRAAEERAHPHPRRGDERARRRERGRVQERLDRLTRAAPRSSSPIASRP